MAKEKIKITEKNQKTNCTESQIKFKNFSKIFPIFKSSSKIFDIPDLKNPFMLEMSKNIMGRNI